MKVLSSTDRRFWQTLGSFCSSSTSATDLATEVGGILAAIRKEGDAALVRFGAQFDGVALTPRGLRVPTSELASAVLTAPERRALQHAWRNVRAFNRRSLPADWSARNPDGAEVGERHYPIRRCGIYIPGGEVPLVSTVVMTVALARLARVPEIVVCTPPGPGGKVSRALLAALHALGVTEVYRLGGAQAIGALAYGTRTVPAVDKIFGPGNAYVVEAKRQVFGTVGVDLLPGPSEVMVIADDTARPDFVAADLLAQAEHGSGKEKVFLVTTSTELCRQVTHEVDEQMARLGRAARTRPVMEHGALAIIVGTLDEAAEVANYVAPEHLELQVAPRAAARLLRLVSTAGAILVGPATPTVLGDFVAGPSHTLPTGRTGRFFSGLRVADFLRRTSVVRYDSESLRRARPTVARFSELERLDGHGQSLEIRFAPKRRPPA
jgi:histidinol dehydrogenase